MALSRTLFLIATLFSTMVVAKDFVVGDESGWTTWFDYQSWAANKVFHLGDTLTFKYDHWKDNVVRVNGSDFVSCSVPWGAPVLSSGNDKIELKTYGRRWYISSVSNHCKVGQKLLITVQPPSQTWSPAPSPSASLPQLSWSPVPSPSPSPAPAPEADSPSWTASVSRRSLLSKKLFQIFNRN